MDCAAACLMLLALAASPAEGDVAPPLSPRAIDRAMAAGSAYLASQISATGMCRDEFPPGNPRHGGKTGIVVYAMLSAAADAKASPLREALEWLTAAELNGTYAVAMRACALAQLKGKEPHPQLSKDVAWLIAAAGADGSYTYTSKDGAATADSAAYDNSNSQAAVMAVAAGQHRGLGVPVDYWQKVERHWLRQQQVDGGWGYVVRGGAGRPQTYGSMTAAGLASLYACFDVLHRQEYLRPLTPEYKPIAEALGWLDKNYQPDANPHKGPNYYYDWLLALSRVGAACGRKQFAAQDWYAHSLRELLDRQNSDGSWGDGPVPTAMAMLTLAQGYQPVLVNKLRYEGKWNVRPRDAAMLCQYIGYTFERPLAWQVVDVDSDYRTWLDAPILYISGAGRVQFSDEQIARLRDYVLAGGLIVSESAGNSGSFTLDMHEAYGRMFPNLALRQLPAAHSVYSGYFTLGDTAGLWGISNGVRPLAVHAPRELSLALELGPDKANRPVFELMGNIYMLASDKGNLPPRGSTPWPAAKPFKPRRTLSVVRLAYSGNDDPEPMAWNRLALLMGVRHNIELQVLGPLPIERLDPRTHPVASLCGTGDFRLNPAQTQALKNYLLGGGTLIADAAGGSAAFVEALESQLLPLLASAPRGPLASHIPFTGPAQISRVYYRRELAQALPADQRKDQRLRCIALPIPGDPTGRARPAVIYSSEDLTSGLLGYPSGAVRGYREDSAVAIMTNLLVYATDMHAKLLAAAKAPPAPVSQPSPPATRPASQAARPRPAPSTKPAVLRPDLGGEF
ncbi:MAG: DUF4159 domain-containing protein [Planctomycetaceae bacterium]|nr:DUF4159 domain-containing protein [Planctomycetaceae bacterium]